MGFALGAMLEKRQFLGLWLAGLAGGSRLGRARALASVCWKIPIFIEQGARMILIDTEADNQQPCTSSRRRALAIRMSTSTCLVTSPAILNTSSASEAALLQVKSVCHQEHS